MKATSKFVAAVLITLGLSTSSRAQDETHTPSGVEGTGAVQIQRLPQKLRLRVTIFSKSATMKGALVGLKHRIETARKKVIALGAAANSIKVEPIKNQGETSTPQGQLALIVAWQGGNRVQAQAKPAENAPVLLTAAFMAEFPLASKEQEALLAESKTLRDSIHSANLSGKEAANELTPAEKNAEEAPAAAILPNVAENAADQTGEPTFVYVSPVSEAEYFQALGQAYRKAQADAVMFAKAAGFELGPIKSVTKAYECGSETDDSELMALFSQFTESTKKTAGTPLRIDEPLEATGSRAAPLKFTVKVGITFEVKATGK